ncbi:MAG TPA: class I SAM-dependent methyltransferase [Candidatus Saccharimonadales bacterium]|nr:class I SAM-dependent methyltransferase [Candidatus Saccharimonadales bacterium]
MNIKNVIYYTPYKKLIKNGVSFSDYSKGKSYYTQLAPLFDATNPRQLHTQAEVSFLLSIVKRYLPQKQYSFLDIACGTGRHLKELAMKGYQVIGVDASKELINIARKSVPDATLVLGDMRTFQLNAKVDCAYSLWDSYVYLSRPDDMKAFANQCSAHIQQGGILVLDSKNYYRESPKVRITHRIATSDNLTIDTLIRREFHPEDKVFEAIFTSIVEDRTTSEAHVIVDQTLARVYDIADLEKYLPGFRLVNCYGDFNDNSEFNPKTSERLIAVFQKA